MEQNAATNTGRWVDVGCTMCVAEWCAKAIFLLLLFSPWSLEQAQNLEVWLISAEWGTAAALQSVSSCKWPGRSWVSGPGKQAGPVRTPLAIGNDQVNVVSVCPGKPWRGGWRRECQGTQRGLGRGHSSTGMREMLVTVSSGPGATVTQGWTELWLVLSSIERWKMLGLGNGSVGKELDIHGSRPEFRSPETT